MTNVHFSLATHIPELKARTCAWPSALFLNEPLDTAKIKDDFIESAFGASFREATVVNVQPTVFPTSETLESSRHLSF